MPDDKKPVIPGVKYTTFDGVVDLENLNKDELSELLKENSGKMPLDVTGKPVMCYAIDVKKRWQGKDDKPVMCYAMPSPPGFDKVKKRPKARIMCYKRLTPNNPDFKKKNKKKDDE